MSLTNGGFEAWSGGAPVGWTYAPSGASTVTQEAAIVHGGASSAKFFVDVPGNSVALDQTMSATPGEHYSASLWHQGANTAAGLAVRITVVGGASNGYRLNASGAWDSGGAFQFYPVLHPASWGQWIAPTSHALPVGATGISYMILRGDGNETWYLDDAALEIASAFAARRSSIRRS